MKTAPFGTWNSLLTPYLVSGASLKLRELCWDADTLYWLEGRPTEKGRQVICRYDPSGEITEVTPVDFSVRSSVHEYGGGAFTVYNQTIYFVSAHDGRIYQHQHGGQAPAAISPPGIRFADLQWDLFRKRIIAIGEDHSKGSEPQNTLASITLDGTYHILDEGHDFYSFCRISPNGRELAWTTWNHPDLPWDNTQLWRASFAEDGSLTNKTLLSSPEPQSIFQPQWNNKNQLHFVSDKTNWWNLYQVDNDSTTALATRDAEFGLPQWVFGQSTYAFLKDTLYCTFFENGRWNLGRIHDVLKPIECPYTDISTLKAGNSSLAFFGGSPTRAPALIVWNPTSNTFKSIRESSTPLLDAFEISGPEPFSFKSGNSTSHAFFYPPKNKQYTGPTTEKPPAIVLSHGGPTGSTSTTLDYAVQYWTQRGFAVIDVNYRGSTGYGRQYRQRLNGNWGIVDTEDCIAAAQFQAKAGKVDEARLLIQGGSAGGFTTLCALAFHDVFKAGASYYGVSDIYALSKTGHKFESRYDHSLIGSDKKVDYDARSPLYHTESLNCPVIFFQGEEDKVVTPDQTDSMVAALKEKGIPVAHMSFKEEAHGFRQSDNIARCLQAHLWFYQCILGLPHQEEPIEGLELFNFPN